MVKHAELAAGLVALAKNGVLSPKETGKAIQELILVEPALMEKVWVKLFSTWPPTQERYFVFSELPSRLISLAQGR